MLMIFVAQICFSQVTARLSAYVDIPGRSGDLIAYNVQVGAFLEAISPTTWASLGIGICIGLSVVGAAWFVFLHFPPALILS